MSTRYRLAAATAMLVALFATSLAVSAQNGQYHPLGTPEFERVWQRTDHPVDAGRVNRTWMWGPGGHTGTLTEEYADAPGGARTVQYTDKSRMEDNSYRASAPWDVTNGHLAKELMTGRLQLGDDKYEQHQPAEVQVAGDPNTNSPTYAVFGDLMDEPALDEGDNIVHEVLSDGTVTDNEVNYNNPADRLAATRRPYAAHYVEETDHTIASVFWDFMNSSGEIYEDGAFRDAQLFQNPFFAIGYPLTEAYWLNVLVAGAGEDVLAQCFERRCLTYNPDNPEGWQVEAGNIGQHYYEWRYNQIGSGSGSSDADDIQLSFDPGTTNSVDDDVMLIALVKDEDDDPVSGVDVEFESDVQGDISTEKTDQSGAAVVLTHEHTTAEFETVTASTPDGGPQDSGTLEWVAGDPAGVSTELYGGSQERFRPIGDIHQILATVFDQHGNPVGGERVEFSLYSGTGAPTDGDTWTFYPAAIGSGIDTDTIEGETTARETNAEGVVGFQYRSGDAGRFTITADHSQASHSVTSVSFCNEVIENGDSIQTAVNDASADDVICVRDGTYAESLTLDVEGLVLLGAGTEDAHAGTAKLDTSPPGDQPGVVIAADDVFVRDFSITRAGSQQTPVVAIEPGVDGTSLSHLDVSAPAAGASTPQDPAIGNLDGSQPVGNVSVSWVTVDRPIGFHLTDGAFGTIQASSVTRSHQTPYWFDWDGGSGKSFFRNNDYSGDYAGAKIRYNIVVQSLNNQSPGSAQEAAEVLVCDNNLDQAEVDGQTATTCP